MHTRSAESYRRADQKGKDPYIAVPEQRRIPNEAINTDWELEARALEIADEADQLPDYAIKRLNEQIAEKGYAVTGLH